MKLTIHPLNVKLNKNKTITQNKKYKFFLNATPAPFVLQNVLLKSYQLIQLLLDKWTEMHDGSKWPDFCLFFFKILIKLSSFMLRSVAEVLTTVADIIFSAFSPPNSQNNFCNNFYSISENYIINLMSLLLLKKYSRRLTLLTMTNH